ncbi:MAG: molybdopterin-binding protein [Candidatus Bathyarchaeia archaeon]|jgi:molybdopterin molybdotransferase
MLRKQLTFEETKHVIEANFKPAFLGEDETVLLEAYNRVLSADVESPVDIPCFDTSRVNGYAVRAEDTVVASEDEPAQLRVAGYVGVGEQPKAVLAKGEAVEVAPGSVLPQGANSVLAFEDAAREDDTLLVYSSAVECENLNRKGSDIQKGELVLKKGQVLGSSEIGVLDALGFKQVGVIKIPMVAVLSIGSDVTELGKDLAPGKTFDLNSYSLSTAFMECGAKPVYFGAVPDDEAQIAQRLKVAVASADMVVACGGNAVEIADSLGQPGVVVNGVAVKPGKQTAIAFVDQKTLFLLPNNPSVALLMYQLLARSLVQRLGGRPISPLRAVTAYAGSKMFGAKGSRTFALVKLMFDDNCRLIAEPVESVGAVSVLAEADGFVEIAQNEQFVDVDQEVTVQLLRGSAGRA